MINKISEIANRQLTDFRNTTPGMRFSEKAFTLKISEAYAVQDALVNLRVNDGDSVIGYKVGFTGLGTTNLFEMQGPIRGTLFKAEMHSDGARIEENQFCNLAIEAEMAIEMGQNGQIVSVSPVIELHNYIFRVPTKSLAELVANNGLNKGIVLGGTALGLHRVQSGQSISVKVDGEVAVQCFVK